MLFALEGAQMDQTALKKVLIVEDSYRYQLDYESALDGKVVLVAAFSITEAEEKFATNPDIDAIVFDACVPGETPTTPPLVRKFRETFTGPMIATSSDPFFQQELVAAGCDYESIKDGLPSKLLEILGIEW